jgi:hypothetical protein
MGSRIHKALEEAEKGVVDTPLVAWRSLIEKDRGALLASGFGTDDLDSEDRLGQAMLSGFMDWEAESGFHNTYEVEAVEKGITDTLTFPEIEGVSLRVRGKLDRVLIRRSDNSRWVGDYKTMGTFSERDMLGLTRSPQPRLYAMLMRAHAPEDQWVAGAVYSLLRKVLRTPRANPPFFAQLVVPVTDYDLESYRLRTVSMVRHILDSVTRLTAGENHRTVVHFAPSWQCQTCPFKAPCWLMQDTGLAAAEAHLSDNFEHGDPWERYDSSE